MMQEHFSHKYNRDGELVEITMLSTGSQRYRPAHPNSDKRGQIYTDRLIASEALCKPLPPNCIIHHHDDGTLVICQDMDYHMLLHARKRALEIAGDPHKRKCTYCKHWDLPENLVIIKTRASYHRSCKALSERNRLNNLWKKQEGGEVK